MAELQSKDIVVLKNNNETIVYPKTTGEAVFLSSGEDLQTFLNNLHNALKFNIVPETDQAVSLGNSTHKFVNIYVVNVIASNVTATTFKGDLQGNVKGNVTGNVSGSVTGNLNGNVNWNGVAAAGTYKVWGAVAN